MLVLLVWGYKAMDVEKTILLDVFCVAFLLLIAYKEWSDSLYKGYLLVS